MTVTINGPNGVTINFPDGTDSATIDQVMTHATTGDHDQAPQAPQQNMQIGLGDVGMAALRGIPIAGGLIERFSSPESQERYKTFDRQNPNLSGGAKLAGGVGSLTLPLGLPGKAGSLAAKGLGMTGDTLAAQTMNSALSGGVIGGLDAAARGNDILGNAEVGAGLGAAAPIAGRLIGSVLSPVTNTIEGIRNPAGVAGKAVSAAIERDTRAGTAGMLDPEFQAAQASGLPVTNLERGGETTRALARSAANTSPEGRAALNAAIDPRFESQASRINNHLDQNFNYPDAFTQKEAIENAARASNNPAYAKALADGDKPIWSPSLERLTGSPEVVSAMKTAAETGKTQAILDGYGGFNPGVTFENGLVKFSRGNNGVPTYPNLQFWDYTKRAIDDAARGATPGSNQKRMMEGLATRLRSELDLHVPSYRAAREGAARAFGAKDALEAGQLFATSKMGNSEARAAHAKLSPAEQKLFQDGYVSQRKAQINEAGDRRSVLNRIANSPAERERDVIALGPQKAAEFHDMLRREAVMDRARPALQGNSTTARQLAELGLAGGAYGLGTGLDVTNPNPSAIAMAALALGAAKGKSAINGNVARHVAELLASHNALPALAKSGLPISHLGTGLLSRALVPAINVQGNR